MMRPNVCGQGHDRVEFRVFCKSAELASKDPAEVRRVAQCEYAQAIADGVSKRDAAKDLRYQYWVAQTLEQMAETGLYYVADMTFCTRAHAASQKTMLARRGVVHDTTVRDVAQLLNVHFADNYPDVPRLAEPDPDPESYVLK
jgi:hypothetical protein